MDDKLRKILNALKSSDSDQREQALDELGIQGSIQNPFDLILPFLQDPNEEVRGTAAFNLGEISDTRAIPYLLELVRNDPSEVARRDALAALGEFQDPEVLALLLEEMKRTPKSRGSRCHD